MQHARKTALALVVLMAIMLAGGCDDADVRKALKAADDISLSLAAAQDVTEAAFKAGTLDVDEARAISEGVQRGTQACDLYTAKVRRLNDSGTNVKPLLTQWTRELLAELKGLNEQGVFYVKNPDARAKLSLAFSAGTTALEILEELLAAP